MNLEIIMIILLATVIVETIVVVVSLLAFNNELKFAVAYMKNHSEFMQNSVQNVKDSTQKQTDIIHEDFSKYAEIFEQQAKIYEKIDARYKEMNNAYKKLLECWKHIDERYDQTYEQFKLAVNKLDELHLKMEDLSCLTTEDEYYLTLSEACDTVCLDCPYENCFKPYCPVYTITHKTEVPDGLEGETAPEPVTMQEIYETNGLEDIRKKDEKT